MENFCDVCRWSCLKPKGVPHIYIISQITSVKYLITHICMQMFLRASIKDGNLHITKKKESMYRGGKSKGGFFFCVRFFPMEIQKKGYFSMEI